MLCMSTGPIPEGHMPDAGPLGLYAFGFTTALLQVRTCTYSPVLLPCLIAWPGAESILGF